MTECNELALIQLAVPHTLMWFSHWPSPFLPGGHLALGLHVMVLTLAWLAGWGDPAGDR